MSSMKTSSASALYLIWRVIISQSLQDDVKEAIIYEFSHFNQSVSYKIDTKYMIGEIAKRLRTHGLILDLGQTILKHLHVKTISALNNT